MKYFSYFSQKIGFDFILRRHRICLKYQIPFSGKMSLISFPEETICLKCQILFSGKISSISFPEDAVEWNGFELIPHPAYSPDLAPSDYFLFPNLKKDIRGRHFWSNEEVVAAVEEWVRDKDPVFFSSGLMALGHCWSKCIILEGNYIQKEEIDLTQK